MAVTEFVFPRLNPDPTLLQALQNTLPAAAKATFSDVPGLLGYYRGKVLKAQNINENTAIDHSGLVIVLEWDKISSFNDFWVSEKFSSFRETIKPFLMGPVAPDLFSSDIHSRSGGTTTKQYVQFIKIGGIESSDERVPNAWWSFISDLKGKKMTYFWAKGVQNTNGFAGMIGWDSLEDYTATVQLSGTESFFREVSTYGQVSSYMLELENYS